MQKVADSSKVFSSKVQNEIGMINKSNDFSPTEKKQLIQLKTLNRFSDEQLSQDMRNVANPTNSIEKLLI